MYSTPFSSQIAFSSSSIGREALERSVSPRQNRSKPPPVPEMPTVTFAPLSVGYHGGTLTFTRTAGGGVNVPYLLAPGTVSDDGATVTLLYGDEGPGSNQVRGRFER